MKKSATSCSRQCPPQTGVLSTDDLIGVNSDRVVASYMRTMTNSLKGLWAGTTNAGVTDDFNFNFNPNPKLNFNHSVKTRRQLAV
jgi:hypothetical protein